MTSEEFKEVHYTIEIDWKKGNVWLNNHKQKEKFVLTKRESESISNAFKLIEAKKKMLI